MASRNPERDARIHALHAAGVSHRKIAAAVGISTTRVRHILDPSSYRLSSARRGSAPSPSPAVDPTPVSTEPLRPPGQEPDQTPTDGPPKPTSRAGTPAHARTDP